MRWSKTYLFTLKEAPNDAEIVSHQLLSRAGMIRKLAPGIYTLQNLALRTLRKIENIIREELNVRGGTEILMPMVHPQELWEETNRWTEMGDGLLKFKNRNQHGFCLGATHEEAVTDLVRKDIRSYRDLPKNLYQIQTKYRDEIRPRFGLMRGREFIMKDAYTFDKSREDALKNYDLMYQAYQAIFNRLGLDYRIVQADAGNIGGSQTHEFQVLAGAGEDHLMVCDKCTYAANIEVAPSSVHIKPESQDPLQPIEKFATPGLKTIQDLSRSLKVPANQLVKTLFFEGVDGKPIAVILRGSDEINPIKLKNAIGGINPPLLLTETEIRAVSGAGPGSCGPHGLKIPIYSDHRLKGFKNFIVGANEDDFHLRNVNFDRDFKAVGFFDLTLAKEGDLCPECKVGKFRSLRGIEVGHVFYLGTKYSEKMGANFLGENGENLPIEMGCYGIGVTRVLQAAVEQNHDADGIIWPKEIAPFALHVCALDPANPEIAELLNKLEAWAIESRIEILIDDREERPGVKFKDADLLGMPLRLNLGARSLQNGEVELVERKTKQQHKIAVKDIFEQLKKYV